MHGSVLGFIAATTFPYHVKDLRILEVGSNYRNGSVRKIFEPHLGNGSYTGIDLFPGRGVDMILDANNLVAEFGYEAFDVVLCTETLEHVEDWRGVLWNLFEVTKAPGAIYLTTRSQPFPYHGYPHDYWRFTPEFIANAAQSAGLYSRTISDPQHPGVLARIVKVRTTLGVPEDFDATGVTPVVLPPGGIHGLRHEDRAKDRD